MKINTPIHTLNTASSIGFKLVTITEKSFTAPDVAHRHNYWAMFYFLKGKGRHLIDFSEIETLPGSIHFVMPGQVHELDAKKNFLAYGILFREEFFLIREETKTLLMKFYNYIDSGSMASFNILKKEKKYFEQLADMMKHEFENDNPYRESVLLDLLTVFISKCIPYFGKTSFTNSVEASGYIKFRNALEENYKTIHLVNDYAALLHINPKTLNQIVKTYTGRSALEIIHERINAEAKRLLKYSDIAIKEITFDLSFTDTSHFTNFFKSKTGFTPQEFRNG